MRTVPGGPHTDIFAYEDDGDALSQAPPKPLNAQVRLRVLCMTFFFDKLTLSISSLVPLRLPLNPQSKKKRVALTSLLV